MLSEISFSQLLKLQFICRVNVQSDELNKYECTNDFALLSAKSWQLTAENGNSGSCLAENCAINTL